MFKIGLFFVFFVMPSVCFAHVVGGESGLYSGLSHPLLGVDHLLAMLAVGILSYQMGGKSVWKIPLVFVIAMLFGGVWGTLSMPMFIAEMGIALSVIVLGIAIFLNKAIPMTIVFSLVSFFAIFHGYAHGIEIPQLASPFIYVIGFLLSTASLHFLGILLAKTSERLTQNVIVVRHIGLLIFMVGCYFMVSVG